MADGTATHGKIGFFLLEYEARILKMLQERYRLLLLLFQLDGIIRSMEVMEFE